MGMYYRNNSSGAPLFWRVWFLAKTEDIIKIIEITDGLELNSMTDSLASNIIPFVVYRHEPNGKIDRTMDYMKPNVEEYVKQGKVDYNIYQD